MKLGLLEFYNYIKLKACKKSRLPSQPGSILFFTFDSTVSTFLLLDKI